MWSEWFADDPFSKGNKGVIYGSGMQRNECICRKAAKSVFCRMYEIRLDWTSIPSCQSRTNNESVYPCQPDIHFVTSRLGYLIAMGFVNIRFRYPLDLFIYIFRQRAVDGKLDIFF